MSAGIKSVLPDGWAEESGDPTVGVYGRTFYHIACLVEGNNEGKEAWMKMGSPKPGYETFRYVVECEDCGEIAIFDIDEFVGFDE